VRLGFTAFSRTYPHMFDVAIYSKTPLGRKEISDRALGLSPRLRHALIMVDGKTTFGALRQLLSPFGDPKAMMQQLSDLRLVESDYDLPEMPDFSGTQLASMRATFQQVSHFPNSLQVELSASAASHPTK
jgi:hypothetical protein